MQYRPPLTSQTEGITPTAPVRWRALDGLMGVFWEAEAREGATGHYVSDDPRILLFFNDVSPHVRVTNQPPGSARAERPMTRALYVPAGLPMWTRFTSAHGFSHLDLHLHRNRLLRFLAPALGQSAAQAALTRPAEIEDTAGLEMLGRLLVGEVTAPTRHGLYAESLAGGIVAGLLDLEGEVEADPREGGRLTGAQMRRLHHGFDAGGGQRLTVAEMAETVGLSESWFSHVFKNTTGLTPLQWQLRRRVELAQDLLAGSDLSVAGIASRLGFSDQAHLTRVFRQVAGATPAAWRRAQRAAR